MSVWAVLASGPSMSLEVAESVRGRCGVVAVSDTYNLAPWADALVSNDSKWWKHNLGAFHFKGRKFCSAHLPGTERLHPTHAFGVCSNSGLQGIRVARDYFGAAKILLLGFDMHGTHFFGLHKAPLRNTTESRRKVHFHQFETFKRTMNGLKVVNCTEGSSLACFPFGKLEEELGELLHTG